MIPGGWHYFSGKNVLLLQGPVGPFFRRLARTLSEAGASSVHSISFNGGDWLFAQPGAMNYRGSLPDLPAFLASVIDRLQVDVIMLFGDCRPVHVVCANVASRCAPELWVFEEGYVRPDFLTMERYGTNGHSLVPADPGFYRSLPETPRDREEAVGATFAAMALWGSLYYLAAGLGRPWFRHYRHHRPLSVAEGRFWLKAAWRKLVYGLNERGVLAHLVQQKTKRYFLVSLQTAIDSQIRVHSRFASMEAFIDEVIVSFSRFCSEPCIEPGIEAYVLVFKHHPLDRGHTDYARFIRQVAAQCGVSGRVLYIHDQHLPTLLAHAAGLVVVNSTVGLSGIHHGLPVKVLGAAVYDLDGLTCQGSLDDFWAQARGCTPDTSLYWRYRSWLIEHTQLNGSFYAGKLARVSMHAWAYERTPGPHSPPLRDESRQDASFHADTSRSGNRWHESLGAHDACSSPVSLTCPVAHRSSSQPALTAGVGAVFCANRLPCRDVSHITRPHEDYNTLKINSCARRYK